MSVSHVIYSQTCTHKGHEFSVWSYVDGGGMPFALRCEGFTDSGFPSREEAVRHARQHIDTLPAEPVDDAPEEAEDAKQANLRQQQAELAFA